jgi:hypothetical protein
MHRSARQVVQCAYCANQYHLLKLLQTRIVHERQHLERLTPAELFTKLYETLKQYETQLLKEKKG